MNDSDVVERAYAFNNPLVKERGGDMDCPIEVVGDGVVMETIKPAEDGSNAQDKVDLVALTFRPWEIKTVLLKTH